MTIVSYICFFHAIRLETPYLMFKQTVNAAIRMKFVAYMNYHLSEYM